MRSAQSEFLEQRPEARAVRVEDLMRDMRSGRLRIPTFQRPFQWQREDARKLIDSIYRGYPIGNLLLWQRPAEAESVRISEGLSVQSEARQDAWWVVDGQQRLVSLARVLLTPEGVTDPFALDIDLDTRAVVGSRDARQRAEDPTRWLPLNRVVDSEQLVAWLVTMQPAPERQQVAIQAGKRLREYDVPVYIVRADSDDVLRQIFGRINASGKPLAAHQVFDALNSGRSGAVPDSLAAMAQDLGSAGFGRLDESLIYRAMRVVQGQDVVESGRDQPQRMAEADAREAYARTQRALAATLRFLVQDAGIPHVRLLPYKEPLVTLAKFFHFHPQLRPRSRQLLARWLWRGALNGSHQGNTVSTREALALVVPEDEEGSVQRLLDRVGRQRPELPSVSRSFHFRHASSKLHALALSELKPRHLVSGERIDLSRWLDDTGSDRDDTLPPMIISSPAGRAWRSTVANRIIHPGQAGLRRLLLGVQRPDVLASHGITAEAVAALAADDADRFLQVRAAVLDALFAEAFERHARWDETDRPSLASLAVIEDD